MTKTIIINGIEFIGGQAFVLLGGAVIGYAFGWTPEDTANFVITAQAAFAAFTIRGWFC